LKEKISLENGMGRNLLGRRKEGKAGKGGTKNSRMRFGPLAVVKSNKMKQGKLR
jgi:hypothetical protein